MIILASARDELRKTTIDTLHEAGLAVSTVSDWSSLCAAATDRRNPLLLVDPELPLLNAELLHGLTQSLSHRPGVFVVGATISPLSRVAGTPTALIRLGRRTTQRAAIAPETRRALRFAGLGAQPIATLAALGARNTPVLVIGERGTGKQEIAAALHHLAGRTGQFRTFEPDAPLDTSGAAGTVFFDAVHRRPNLRADVRAALSAGWAVTGGMRKPDPPPGVTWMELRLPPLRERAEDLRGLTQLYIEIHAARLGQPRRSFDKALWSAVMAHRWPENGRELEAFVAAALTAVDQPVIRQKALPVGVAERLQARNDEMAEGLEGFESVVETRLGAVVARFVPGHGTSLWELVTSTTGRALIRLALARTGGNRKAAAELLGVARNTLQAHVERYGISAAPR